MMLIINEFNTVTTAEYKKHNWCMRIARKTAKLFTCLDPTKPGNVSLLMKPDGVAVSKSSKKRLGPYE